LQVFCFACLPKCGVRRRAGLKLGTWFTMVGSRGSGATEPAPLLALHWPGR